MEKKLRNMEDLIEQSLDRLTSHPAFLQTVSNIINLNSYRKIWTRKALHALWKDLELPTKTDQERILLSLQEMQIRIKKMQMELEAKENELNRLKIINKEKKRPVAANSSTAATGVNTNRRTAQPQETMVVLEV